MGTSNTNSQFFYNSSIQGIVRQIQNLQLHPMIDLESMHHGLRTFGRQASVAQSQLPQMPDTGQCWTNAIHCSINCIMFTSSKRHVGKPLVMQYTARKSLHMTTFHFCLVPTGTQTMVVVQKGLGNTCTKCFALGHRMQRTQSIVSG